MSGLDPRTVFVSTITYGEIQRGATLQTRRDPAFAEILQNWLAGIRRDFGDRALPVTGPVAVEWGQLRGRLGRDDPDLMIAATGIVHDLTVVTRNVTDFTPTGVRVHNPFDA